MVVQVRVITPSGEEEIINLCDTEEQFQSITVLQLKKKIHERCSNWEPERVRLVFGIQSLEDSSLLTSYGIRHMSTIHSVLLLPGGGGGPGWGDGGMGDKEGKKPKSVEGKDKRQYMNYETIKDSEKKRGDIRHKTPLPRPTAVKSSPQGLMPRISQQSSTGATQNMLTTCHHQVSPEQ